MGWYKRSQLSMGAFRNVSEGTKHQARNPVGSSPISGKNSHFSNEWNLGFCGSSLISSRFVHMGGALRQALINVLVRAGKRSYKFPNFKPSGFEKWIEKPRNFSLILLLGSGITVYLCNLETIPYTNRTHFVFMSMQTERIYGEIGMLFLKEALLKGKVLAANHPDSVRVKLIAKNVIDAFQKEIVLQNDPDLGSHKRVKVTWKNNKCLNVEYYHYGARPYTRGMERLRWEIVVVNSPSTVGTMSILGGKILVYSGILKHFETDAELAFFIANEVGRVVARHWPEGMTKKIGKRILKELLSHFVSRDVLDNMSLFKYGQCSTELEIEAHNIGLMLMASAGYDPSTAISTYEKLGNLTRRLPDPPCMMQAQLLLQTQAMEKAMNLYRAKMSDHQSN